MSNITNQNKAKNGKAMRPVGYVLGLVVVVALMVLPIVVNPTAEYSGADDQGAKVIAELHPGYEPWFSAIWEPPSGEIASLLFALQAAIGAGVVFFGLGYLYGRSQANPKEKAEK